MKDSGAFRDPPVRMADHFSIFIYPFEHGFEEKGRPRFLDQAWRGGWRPWIWRLPDGAALVDRLTELDRRHSPALMDFVYPEYRWLTGCAEVYPHFCSAYLKQRCGNCPGPSNPATLGRLADTLHEKTRSAKRGRDCLPHLWAGLNRHATLHLTVDFGDEKRRFGEYRFASGSRKEDFRFKIDWVDAFLFSSGTGLLCMKTTLLAPAKKPRKESDADRLTLFHRQFREINRRSEKLGFLEQWLGSLTGKAASAPPGPPLPGLARRASRFHLFAHIHLDNAYGQYNPPVCPETYYSIELYYRGIDRFDALLYDMAVAQYPESIKKDGPSKPSLEYLKTSLLPSHRVFLWKNRRAMIMDDTAVFATLSDPGPPSSKVHEEIFFPLHLQALAQKARLLWFADRLNPKWLEEEGEEAAWEIHRAFSAFKNEQWHVGDGGEPELASLRRVYRSALSLERSFRRAESAVADLETVSRQRYRRHRILQAWAVIVLLLLLLLMSIPH